MAILNKYYTTWTSDDSQLYKLEIIPSHTANDAQDTLTSGFVETQLPDDFLLRDMTFEASLGDIPLGIATQSLKINFNIGADGSDTINYSVLRNKLLRGTDSTCQPIDSGGSIIGLEADFGFKCFNTFILSRSDDSGSTYVPIFIGCQKFAADNEIELTKLSPVIKISVEIYDIGRCIGEIIKPRIWFYYLKCKHELVNYGSQCNTLQYEDKEYHDMEIAYHFGQQPSNYNYLLSYFMYNQLLGGLTYKIQTIRSLFVKIDTMYTDHMVSLLCSPCNFYFDLSNTIDFYTLSTPSIAGTILDQFDDVCIVSEVNDAKFLDSDYPNIYGNCIGGILKDKEGFGQFTNFHEVINSIAENFMHKGTQTYGYGGGSYSVEVLMDYMLPQYSTNFSVQQSTVYDSVKFKLFNETLNTCKAVVSNIQGDSDTTDWTYNEQATSGDNSKDLKLLFHNLPLLTSGFKRINDIFNPPPPERIAYDASQYYIRNTINPGTLCYLSDDGEVRKVDTNCRINYRFNKPLSKSNIINRDETFVQQVITEQQNNGLPYNLCYAIVYTMAQPTFKTVEFRTTSKPNSQSTLRGIEPVKFGRSASILYGNLNQILGVWDPPTPAISVLGTVVNYSLDIWSGMVDAKLIAHGVTVT